MASKLSDDIKKNDEGNENATKCCPEDVKISTSEGLDLEKLENLENKFNDFYKYYKHLEDRRFYNYLYLDPRLLPKFSGNTPVDKTLWSGFLDAIFYIGKGTGRRQTMHLTRTGSKEAFRRCNEIEKDGMEAIIFRIFDNSFEKEALNREAAMISALGIENLTNKIGGSFYGEFRDWDLEEKHDLGISFIYKGMKAFYQQQNDNGNRAILDSTNETSNNENNERLTEQGAIKKKALPVEKTRLNEMCKICYTSLHSNSVKCSKCNFVFIHKKCQDPSENVENAICVKCQEIKVENLARKNITELCTICFKTLRLDSAKCVKCNAAVAHSKCLDSIKKDDVKCMKCKNQFLNMEGDQNFLNMKCNVCFKNFQQDSIKCIVCNRFVTHLKCLGKTKENKMVCEDCTNSFTTISNSDGSGLENTCNVCLGRLQHNSVKCIQCNKLTMHKKCLGKTSEVELRCEDCINSFLGFTKTEEELLENKCDTCFKPLKRNTVKCYVCKKVTRHAECLGTTRKEELRCLECKYNFRDILKDNNNILESTCDMCHENLKHNSIKCVQCNKVTRHKKCLGMTRGEDLICGECNNPFTQVKYASGNHGLLNIPNNLSNFTYNLFDDYAADSETLGICRYCGNKLKSNSAKCVRCSKVTAHLKCLEPITKEELLCDQCTSYFPRQSYGASGSTRENLLSNSYFDLYSSKNISSFDTNSGFMDNANACMVCYAPLNSRSVSCIRCYKLVVHAKCRGSTRREDFICASCY